ncbi:MAG TPA: beta-ketoacyl synthase N-terminal-like domain-containing protein [Sedimentisphaerales bacterium]|jgi:3-oxoacyl-[acyl-carrier-protein] synthase II|nr:beta-ketoacyl synthase N-terminal-like domain-containing protein [Sedimentisphaerales bacterium]HNU31618.1 beta-ketoacyl synthase N-terminal-like domain-containing protein [Sedimentisphaerales bacterium]
MTAARVVITGLGTVGPLGLTVEEMWAGLSTGRCGIARIKAIDPTGFACQIAGEVPPYRVQDHVPKAIRKAVKLMCRDIELAVVAAREAVASSGLVTKGIDPERVNVDPTRVAITLGAGMISCDLAELGPAIAVSTTDGRFDVRKWGKDGLSHITPLWLLKYLPNMLACHIGIIHDIQGPSNTITCAEAAAALAIGEAAQILARGGADIALAGAAEAKVNLMMLVRQELLKRAVTNSNDAPERACRPFDADAAGLVVGEGAGILVLETLDHARARGTKVLGEIAGIGQSHSLHPEYKSLEPDGQGIRVAVEKAMADAGIGPNDLDLIVPHGTGVLHDDLAEARGLDAALGSAIHRIPAWPTKSMMGTAGAAAGALDIIAAVRAMECGIVPPARNFTKPATGCHLNISTQRREGRLRNVLCCSYTPGGQTAAVVLTAVQGDATS